MDDQNLNDPRNKRLVQDDVDQRNAKYSNGIMITLAFLVVLAAVVGFVFYANNQPVNAPLPNAMQQAAATRATAAPANNGAINSFNSQANAPAPANSIPNNNQTTPANNIPNSNNTAPVNNMPANNMPNNNTPTTNSVNAPANDQTNPATNAPANDQTNQSNPATSAPSNDQTNSTTNAPANSTATPPATTP